MQATDHRLTALVTTALIAGSTLALFGWETVPPVPPAVTQIPMSLGGSMGAARRGAGRRRLEPESEKVAADPAATPLLELRTSIDRTLTELESFLVAEGKTAHHWEERLHLVDPAILGGARTTEILFGAALEPTATPLRRVAAAEVLRVALGADPLPPGSARLTGMLHELLETAPETAAYAAAARSLAYFGMAADQEALLDKLGVDDAEPRTLAWALGGARGDYVPLALATRLDENRGSQSRELTLLALAEAFGNELAARSEATRDTAAAAVVRLLNSPELSETTVLDAVTALRKIGGPRSTAGLEVLLGRADISPHMEASVAVTLAHVGGPAFVAKATALLEDQTIAPSRRVSLAEAIVRAPTSADVTETQRALAASHLGVIAESDSSAALRRRALYALAGAGDPAVVPALVQRASLDADATVRAAALFALDRLDPSDRYLGVMHHLREHDPSAALRAQARQVLRNRVKEMSQIR